MVETLDLDYFYFYNSFHCFRFNFYFYSFDFYCFRFHEKLLLLALLLPALPLPALLLPASASISLAWSGRTLKNSKGRICKCLNEISNTRAKDFSWRQIAVQSPQALRGYFRSTRFLIWLSRYTPWRMHIMQGVPP